MLLHRRWAVLSARASTFAPAAMAAAAAAAVDTKDEVHEGSWIGMAPCTPETALNTPPAPSESVRRTDESIKTRDTGNSSYRDAAAHLKSGIFFLSIFHLSRAHALINLVGNHDYFAQKAEPDVGICTQ